MKVTGQVCRKLMCSAAIFVIGSTFVPPVFAQNADDAVDAESEPDNTINDRDVIIVTAQRQAQRLQDVPIAVSAFTSEALEAQQIDNSSDLQLTLPNVTFTKTNFTSASFTIRGIGDLCTGVTCDTATAIHINDMPLLQTRLFETEFFDLERVEVLRGPQGTLFGRNATSGVVNFITAKPDLSKFSAAAEGEYGNFNSIKVKGSVNVPLGDTLGVRLAGYYLNRDGYTENIATGNRIDDRDLYAFRGSLRWEPTSGTTVDLMAYYFREDDNRSRIQKQLCHRDPTGVLGCLPDSLQSETLNGDSTLAAIQTSSEFLAVAVSPAFAPFGLGSVYADDGDVYSGFNNPKDIRQVRIDYEPTYFAEEEQYQLKFRQDIGDTLTFNLTGGYNRDSVDSRTDYNLAIERSYANNPGLLALAAASAAPGPFQALAAVLIPNGPAGGICQSDAEPSGTGVYGGNSIGCPDTSLDFDRSRQVTRQYSVEGHLDSDFNGMFNFLLGGIYVHQEAVNDYYVNAFGLDYATGIVGAATAASGATGGTNVYLGTPFYNNHSDLYRLKSYGIFGEGYFDISDALKLTIGLRYNNDDKFVRARTTYFVDAVGNSPLLPYNATRLEDALNFAGTDYDAGTPGVQPFAERNVSFDKLTGRAVLDYKITPDNLIYASYSRGYKSGGINPPLSAVFAVPEGFAPEQVDSFEVGSKNSFGNGTLSLNFTGFYYKYKNLQLSRIVARTSVNDNVDANIWGLEAEAVLAPARNFLVNLNASYLNTEVSSDKLLSNPRDPSGGRNDAVIIKDLTNASNCAVYSETGGQAGASAFVGAINGSVGLRAPTPVPGTNGATGAFSICSVLQAQADAIGAAFGGITFAPSGVEVNIRGNELPQAPEFKWSAGVQWTKEIGNFNIVPRFDITYTGESFGSIFNGNINRIEGYAIMNAQVQLNGPDDKWFVRGFLQNIGDNNAVTGQYVTDASSGLFTNIFTLEPRRYGIAAGVKF